MDTSERVSNVEQIRVMVSGTAVSPQVKNLIDQHLNTIAQELKKKDAKIVELKQRLTLYKKRYPEFKIMTPPDAINAWIEANK